jgi:aminopeptidase N
MLGECVKRYAGGTLSTAQFRALAAEFLPAGSFDPKLENFFEAWVYGTGVPSLKMTWRSEGRAPAITITGTVTQSGTPEEFEIFVPLQVQFARGAMETHWVKTSADPVTFTFKTKTPAVKVLLDPQGSVLLDRK